MNSEENNKAENFSFSKPAVYQIKIKGILDKSKSNYMAGMQITTEYKKGKQPVSVLIGKLKDQSALSGILNTLYEMHLPVISVKLLKDN